MESLKFLPTATTNFDDFNLTTSNGINHQGRCAIREFDVASLFIQLVMAIIIVVPNAAVVRVILTAQNQLYQKPAYYLIASLAIADIFVAVYVIISVVIADLAGTQMTAFLWAIMYSCGSIPFYVSVLHLLLIAIDRLCFIGYNKIYQKYMSRKTIFCLILACWILALTPILAVALGTGACGKLCDCPDGGVLNCTDFQCSSIFIVYTKSYLFGHIFLVLFVIVVITALYAALFWKVHEKSQKVRSYCNPSAHHSHIRGMQREFRLARTLAIVILVFFVCWGPLMIGYIVDYSLPFETRIGETVGNLLSIPNLINSVSNPVIYAARMKHMREALIPCSKRDGSQIISSTSTRSRKNPLKKRKKHCGSVSTDTEERTRSIELYEYNNSTEPTTRRCSSYTSRLSKGSYGYSRGSQTIEWFPPLSADERNTLSPAFADVFDEIEIEK